MNYLIIPDLQVPFEHKNALKFCKQIQKEFNIPKEGIISVGDEVDNYWGGTYGKDPDSLFGPAGELILCKKKLQPWFDAFPIMKLAKSNHGSRWIRVFPKCDALRLSLLSRARQTFIQASCPDRQPRCL